MKNAMQFIVDKDNRKINVERGFAAPVSKVWTAWTTAEILDKWWAPHPYRTETKSLDFTPGGFWHYAMVSPEGLRHWGRSDYQSIETGKSFSTLNGFCDENAKLNEDFSRSLWEVQFNDNGGDTTVSINITYKDVAALERIIEMGFKEGFTMGLGNLEALLAE